MFQMSCNRRFLPILALFLLILIVATRSSSNSDNNPRQNENKMEEEHVLPGGYHQPADMEDPRLMEAAEFAVSAVMKGDAKEAAYSFVPKLLEVDQSANKNKVEILRASQQVVAGMNYRLTVAVMNSEGVCLGAFKCIVYNQFGTLSVTDWNEEVQCEEAMNLLSARPPKQTQDPPT